MSDELSIDGVPPKEDPEHFVLRGKPRSVVRIKRSLIILFAGTAITALSGLSWVALQPVNLHRGGALVDQSDPLSKPSEDALQDVPKDYAHVPKLGPPLPGDLGAPILEHERSISSESAPLNDGSTDLQRRAELAEQQRVEIAKVRGSPLIVALQSGVTGHGPDSPAQTPSATEVQSIQGPNAARAGSAEKISFARFGRQAELAPKSRTIDENHRLSAGTVIAASLVTGLNSDLPGSVIAQVTENVRDSASGSFILIPQGARLLGKYDNRISYGQRRALLVWTKLIFPDGSSLSLDNLAATDAQGFSGVEDKVHGHSWQLIKGVALASLLGAGTELSFGGGNNLVRAIRESIQQNGANAGNSIVAKGLDIQPTIAVRPGWPVRALLTEDITLPEWTEGSSSTEGM